MKLTFIYLKRKMIIWGWHLSNALIYYMSVSPGVNKVHAEHNSAVHSKNRGTTGSLRAPQSLLFYDYLKKTWSYRGIHRRAGVGTQCWEFRS